MIGVIRAVRSWPRRVKDSVSQEGLGSFALRMVLWRAYRAGVILAKPLAPPAGQADVQLRVASTDDVLALLAVRSVYTAETLQSWLRDGEECILGLVNGAIAAHRWVKTGIFRMPHLGLLLDLREDEISVHDVYVMPDFRGRGITAAANHTFDAPYLERGFRMEFSYATAGRGPWGRGHAYGIASIRTLRLGPFRKFWVKALGPEAEYWQERLKELRWA